MTSPASDRPSVLVCEWDSDLRTVLAALLARAGYRVSLARDARETISVAIASPPDCIVLSLPFAGGESADILRSLHGLAATTRLVVIASESAAADRFAGDEWIPPTFGPADILAAVKRVTARRLRAAPAPAPEPSTLAGPG